MVEMLKGQEGEGKWRRELIKGCQQLGVQLSEEQALSFQAYWAHLKFWNPQARLVSSGDEDKVMSRHFLDSLSLLKVLDLRAGARVLDVGSGGGFPGFPVKICRPKISLTILEPRERKFFFLKSLTATLRMQEVTLLCKRAQEACRDPGLREVFDLVLARALANMKELVDMCFPFVREGGIFVAYKGRRVEEEMTQARKRIQHVGGEVLGVVPVHVPGTSAQRNLVVTAKIYERMKEKEIR
jgi:16S rRNA (guanine527-N7)-methyltransferase